MTFDPKSCLESLERFPDVLRALVKGLRDEDVRWRPESGAWSILEIVSHLVDEEVEDFRTRLFLVLKDADAPWPPITPEAWVVERKYQERDFSEQLNRFAEFREESLLRIVQYPDPDWTATFRHPVADMSAAQLLAAWVEHDFLHLRQLTHRLYQLSRHKNESALSHYAGDWAPREE